MTDLHAEFCDRLQPMIEDIARQMEADWRGEHLIRSTPRSADPARAAWARAEVDAIAEPPTEAAEKVQAVRNAMLAGLSRVQAAEVTGLSYNTVVWICQRHGIVFPDARVRRRRTGGIA